ncbi:MAG: cupin domain-containing protein [Acidobacteria bacterium]|nr:cupin domain-containing protein [Acidobacteriota bacterium]
MNRENSEDAVLILKNGEGREYRLGPMTAVFKADERETASRYSISEWRLDPRSEGPGEHFHDDKEHIFFVLEGTVSVLAGDGWVEAEKGDFIRIPRNTTHTFANRTDREAAFLNIDVPGGFESELPAMVRWFAEQKP